MLNTPLPLPDEHSNKNGGQGEGEPQNQAADGKASRIAKGRMYPEKISERALVDFDEPYWNPIFICPETVG